MFYQFETHNAKKKISIISGIQDKILELNLGEGTTFKFGRYPKVRFTLA